MVDYPKQVWGPEIARFGDYPTGVFTEIAHGILPKTGSAEVGKLRKGSVHRMRMVRNG